MAEVPSVGFLEVQLVSVIAPFLLNARLKPPDAPHPGAQRPRRERLRCGGAVPPKFQDHPAFSHQHGRSRVKQDESRLSPNRISSLTWAKDGPEPQTIAAERRIVAIPTRQAIAEGEVIPTAAQILTGEARPNPVRIVSDRRIHASGRADFLIRKVRRACPATWPRLAV